MSTRKYLVPTRPDITYRRLGVILLILNILCGCGGGGGASSNPPESHATLTGIAAAGGPIANGIVTLKDSAGRTLTTTADANGGYSFDVSNSTPPYMLQAQPSTPGSMPLYSLAFTQGIANTTPLTNLAVYEAQGRADPATTYSTGMFPHLTESAFGNGQAIVLQNLDTLFRNQGVDPTNVNLVTTPMVANGQGIDAVMDNLNVAAVGVSPLVWNVNGACIPYGPENVMTFSIDGMSLSILTQLFGAESLADSMSDEYVKVALVKACVPGIDQRRPVAPNYQNPPIIESNITWVRTILFQDTVNAVDELKTQLLNAYNSNMLATTYGGHPGPINVVAHSWGTVIAYMAMLELEAEGSPIKVANLITLGSPIQCLSPADVCIKNLVIAWNVPQELLAPVHMPSNVSLWTNYWSLDDPISSRIRATGVQNKYVDCVGTIRNGDPTPVLPSISSCNILWDLVQKDWGQIIKNHVETYFGDPSSTNVSPVFSDIRALVRSSQADPSSTGGNPPPQGNSEPAKSPLPFSLSADQPYCDNNAPVGPALTLRWTKSIYANNYRVYRDDSPIGSLLISSQQSFINNLGLIAGQTYRYKIQALGVGGVVWTDPVDINIPADVCSSPNPGPGTGGNNPPALDAQITVGPTILDFGAVQPGSCATALLAIQHVLGTAPVSGSVIVSPPFTALTNQTFSVSNGDSVNVEIGFCPTSTGSSSSSAAVISNATSTNQNTISLTGSGVSAGSPSQLIVATTSLPTGSVGVNYNVALSASGSTSPYTWSLASGSQLPQGLILDGTGVISGVPTISGTSTITVQAKDSGSPTMTALQTLHITIWGVPPTPFTLNSTSECSNNAPQIRLTWSSASDVDFYQIYRDGELVAGESNNVNSYIDTYVAVGSSHSYVVKAINSGGYTDSNTSTVTASCNALPGAFTLTVTPSCEGNAPVNLIEWTGSAGRTLPYDVYRDGALIFSDQNSSRYTDTSITSGGTYNYIVGAGNSVGTTNSNQVSVLSKNDCAAPIAPVITSISPQSVTVGDSNFTLTLTGKYFDSSARILWAFGSDTPSTNVTSTIVNDTTMTISVNRTSGGFSPFIYPGDISLQALKPGPNYYDGQRSNTVSFAIYNPSPIISSIAGNCRANLNCTPANGFDVRVNGDGFVNNLVNGNASSTYAEINGVSTPVIPSGQGPVYSQLQLYVNGSLIPIPGTYSLKLCNEGTAQGTSCVSTTLNVDP